MNFDLDARGTEYVSEDETAIVLSDLLDELTRFIRRYIVLASEEAQVCALWVAHTWAFGAADTTPYLWVTSPAKGSGKTRLLEVLNLLVAKPWLTGRVTAAVLVRKVDAESPTLLLDESDAAFRGEKEYAEALRGILNSGYARSGKASLCTGQGANLGYKDFSTFAPKAIAGIGTLPDTVADRSIPIRLRRRIVAEPVERFRRRKVEPAATGLKERVELWAASATRTLTDAEPELPDELTDRAQDVAEPLLAIADLAGGEWPGRARRAVVMLYTGNDVEDDSIGVRLLRDCRTLFYPADSEGKALDPVEKLSSADLCAALVAIAEAPWGESNHGRPLTLRGLARLLHPFEVRPGSIRLADGTTEGTTAKKTAKGYYRVDFEDAWSRWLPLSGSRSGTTSQPNTGAGFLDFSNRHTEKRCVG